MANSNRVYSGTLKRRYTVDIPGDPGQARPAQHRTDEGHLTDTSGRDEAPRGGGWVPADYLAVQPGPRDTPESDYVQTHQHTGNHRVNDGGGLAEAYTGRGWLSYLRSKLPDRPNSPETLTNAGASGAAHGGLGERGMDPTGATGRRTADGRYVSPETRLGVTYTHPIERVRRGLHFNRPTLRRILAPSIARERGGPSPGGYSSAYDPAKSAWSAGPRQPTLRRLVQSYGQAEYDTVSQEPGNARRGNPGPIGNGGW